MTTTKRLDIRDLPRDPQHFQGPLRIQLVKMANYVRKYPNKADALVNTLEDVLSHIKANIDGIEEEAEPSLIDQLTTLKAGVTKLTSKSAVIEQAAKVGLTLEDSATRAELDAALITKYEEIITVQETK
tara:strand:+ start:3533 stop:3919 length:387 start_codon:yes stop_codon:yes gene_type:complete